MALWFLFLLSTLGSYTSSALHFRELPYDQFYDTWENSFNLGEFQNKISNTGGGSLRGGQDETLHIAGKHQSSFTPYDGKKSDTSKYLDPRKVESSPLDKGPSIQPESSILEILPSNINLLISDVKPRIKEPSPNQASPDPIQNEVSLGFLKQGDPASVEVDTGRRVGLKEGARKTKNVILNESAERKVIKRKDPKTDFADLASSLSNHKSELEKIPLKDGAGVGNVGLLIQFEPTHYADSVGKVPANLTNIEKDLLKGEIGGNADDSRLNRSSHLNPARKPTSTDGAQPTLVKREGLDEGLTGTEGANEVVSSYVVVHTYVDSKDDATENASHRPYLGDVLEFVGENPRSSPLLEPVADSVRYVERRGKKFNRKNTNEGKPPRAESQGRTHNPRSGSQKVLENDVIEADDLSVDVKIDTGIPDAGVQRDRRQEKVLENAPYKKPRELNDVPRGNALVKQPESEMETGKPARAPVSLKIEPGVVKRENVIGLNGSPSLTDTSLKSMKKASTKRSKLDGYNNVFKMFGEIVETLKLLNKLHKNTFESNLKMGKMMGNAKRPRYSMPWEMFNSKIVKAPRRWRNLVEKASNLEPKVSDRRGTTFLGSNIFSSEKENHLNGRPGTLVRQSYKGKLMRTPKIWNALNENAVFDPSEVEDNLSEGKMSANDIDGNAFNTYKQFANRPRTKMAEKYRKPHKPNLKNVLSQPFKSPREYVSFPYQKWLANDADEQYTKDTKTLWPGKFHRELREQNVIASSLVPNSLKRRISANTPTQRKQESGFKKTHNPPFKHERGEKDQILAEKARKSLVSSKTEDFLDSPNCLFFLLNRGKNSRAFSRDVFQQPDTIDFNFLNDKTFHGMHSSEDRKPSLPGKYYRKPSLIGEFLSLLSGGYFSRQKLKYSKPKVGLPQQEPHLMMGIYPRSNHPDDHVKDLLGIVKTVDAENTFEPSMLGTPQEERYTVHMASQNKKHPKSVADLNGPMQLKPAELRLGSINGRPELFEFTPEKKLLTERKTYATDAALDDFHMLPSMSYPRVERRIPPGHKVKEQRIRRSSRKDYEPLRNDGTPAQATENFYRYSWPYSQLIPDSSQENWSPPDMLLTKQTNYGRKSYFKDRVTEDITKAEPITEAFHRFSWPYRNSNPPIKQRPGLFRESVANRNSLGLPQEIYITANEAGSLSEMPASHGDFLMHPLQEDIKTYPIIYHVPPGNKQAFFGTQHADYFNDLSDQVDKLSLKMGSGTILPHSLPLYSGFNSYPAAGQWLPPEKGYSEQRFLRPTGEMLAEDTKPVGTVARNHKLPTHSDNFYSFSWPYRLF